MDRPIGMFDSGFGGLTVARAVIDLLPHEHLVYIGDTGRYPYGPRPHPWAISSAGERPPHTREVVGSNPTSPTTLTATRPSARPAVLSRDDD